MSPQNPLDCETINYHILSVELSLCDLNFMAEESKIIAKKNSLAYLARESQGREKDISTSA